MNRQLQLFPDEEFRITPPGPSDGSDKSDKSDYDAFVEKFKPKKTTDDCYTPPPVYEAVRAWALRHFPDWEGRPVVRPFFPGGDFEHYPYPEGCVVIDNPPFSCYSRIVRWYTARGIEFLLFAPGLTALVPGADVTYLLAGADITYANGAVVHTNFVTNHASDLRLDTVPDLRRAIDRAVKEAAREKKKPPVRRLRFSPHVLTAALCGSISDRKIELQVRKDQCRYIRHTGPDRTQLFGTGLLLSDGARRAADEARRAADEGVIHIPLSRQEQDIVDELNRTEKHAGNDLAEL